jgi:hypothetical protein
MPDAFDFLRHKSSADSAGFYLRTLRHFVADLFGGALTDVELGYRQSA